MRRFWVIVGLTALPFLCRVAQGQNNGSARDLQREQRLQELQQLELDTRLLANPSIPPGQRALIDYGGYFSPQYFSIDDANGDNHVLREYDLVGYFRANFDGANEVFLRGRAQYNDYNPGDSFDGFGSRLINPDFDRAYYKFDLQQFESAYKGKKINGDISIEGGRDLLYWGNGLSVGEVVDGVMPAVSYGPFSLAAVAGVTPTRTVDFEPDRPEFSFNTRRGFYGALLSVDVAQQHPYIYGLVQRDYNKQNQSIIGPITTQYSYNSNYLGIGSTGALSDHFRYGVEAVYESGNTLSDSSAVSGFTLVPVTQTRDQIRAYAADIKIDYLPQDSHNSRFTVEALAASGDTDRGLTNTTFNGNAPGTRDDAFNGFGLVSTGLAFGAPVSNLQVYRFGASTFPLINHSTFRRLQLGMDIYCFDKANPLAPIDQSTNAGVTYLGWEPDFYINWELASDVTLTFRYGVFMPNSRAFANDKARQFLYSGAVFAF
jgi:hypothetical protein